MAAFCFPSDSGSVWTLNPAGCPADAVDWVKDTVQPSRLPVRLSLSLTLASVHKASANLFSLGFESEETWVRKEMGTENETLETEHA